VRFLEESSILDREVMDPAAAVALLAGREEDEVYSTEVLDQDERVLVVRAIEKKTGLAQTHRVKRSLFDAPEYRTFVKVHKQLAELAGTPPFTVTLNDKTEEALSFEALRGTVMSVAQKGVTLNRFKGLGEMNAEQLRETTMDPATRTLQQVTMEDAFAADRLFSMLMGDQVEPRREFIEDNARAVANLDV
jgi:DNA gyrase subunit B